MDIKATEYLHLLLLLVYLKSNSATNQVSRPHIIFILADDLGFNDVSFHGSAEIMTPNIDMLAFSGIPLDRYYVNPICTPSRSALMTGKYPIHTGMQHTVLYGAEPRGLPLTEKLLPEYLKELGYGTHIVGKWHLGHYKREYTPLYRGFDTHTGFWTGHHDYFDHTAVEKPSWGLDMRRGMDIAYDLHGKYSTDIITSETLDIITKHNSSNPLFIYIAHAAVHSGNPYNPLPAPDSAVAKLTHISNFNRRKFGAMLTQLDESVGSVIAALQSQNMLKDSIIVFSSDNGGPAEGFNLNAASNWPLRGVKNTLWEGGVRGAGLIWSPLIKKQRRVATQKMQVADWLPTLYNAAGGNAENLPTDLDGINIWPALSNDLPSPRHEILHNIDDIWGSAALTVNEWKIVKGTNYNGNWDFWYGPSGLRNESSYNVNTLLTSLTGKALSKLNMAPSIEEIRNLRKKAIPNCIETLNFPVTNIICQPLIKPCLFNVYADPCEQYNLAERYPTILETLLRALETYNSTAIPAGNLPLDSRGDPRFWDNTWTNFGDYSFLKNAVGVNV